VISSETLPERSKEHNTLKRSDKNGAGFAELAEALPVRSLTKRLAEFREKRGFGNDEIEVAENATLRALRDYFRFARQPSRTPGSSETQ